MLLSYVQSIKTNGFVCVLTDLLRIEYRFENCIRRYNRDAEPGFLIQMRTTPNEKLKRVKIILKKNPKLKLDEIKALLELKVYFDSLGIKESEIIKKRNVILTELRKKFPKHNLSIIYSEIIHEPTKVQFVRINDLLQYEQQLLNDKLLDGKVFYRGQANCDWSIMPSIYRNNWIKHEQEIVREMQLRNPSDFQNASTTLEKLTKMQHYNAPTRLLDLTKNPLIALYFACEEIKEQEEQSYGEILFFEPINKCEKYFDSDTVSIISNLSMMDPSFSTKGLSRTSPRIFNKQGMIPLLLHQIRYEKMNFLPIIEPPDLHKCIIVHVKLDNKRIINQQGLFLLVGMDNNKTKPADVFKYLIKRNNKRIVYLIDPKSKKKILDDLDKMNINKGFIYPEIDDVADYIKNYMFK